MIIRDLLNQAEGELAGRESRRLEVEVLLAHALGMTKEQLFCSYQQEVEDARLHLFYQGVGQLREGRPLTYILGEKEFYGRSFVVREGVLIPRPETEWLVEKVLRLVGAYFPYSASIIDIGTGSGCIGLSIAKEVPNARVDLVDISEEALVIARENAERLGLTDRVAISQSDLLNQKFDQTFEIMVANLPYIGTEKYHFLASDVEKYEPHVALFGGYDGLQLYKKLFQQIVSLKHPPKFLLGEYGFAQTDDLVALLNTFFVHGGATYRIVQDLAGIDRYFIVSLAGLPL